MANPKTLFRKATTDQLRRYFDKRRVRISEEFEWTLTGKGLADALEDVLVKQPQKLEDEVRSELDMICVLSERDGWTALEERCRAEEIDLDDFDSPHDAAFMLVLDYPVIFESILAAASLKRRNGGRDWSHFAFSNADRSAAISDPKLRDSFVKRALAILKTPAGRRSEADWYDVIRIDPATGVPIRVSQVTIYVEERPDVALAFDASSTIQRLVSPRVAELGFAFDPVDRVFEVCARGPRNMRAEYASAFSSVFLGEEVKPIEIEDRPINFLPLSEPPDFRIDPKDSIEQIEVSELSFWHDGGGFASFQHRAKDETIYDFLERQFGPMSPLRADGWKMTAATLRIIRHIEGERRKTLTIDLKSLNRTTLRNKTEKDRAFVKALLERWGILEPVKTPETVFEEA